MEISEGDVIPLFLFFFLSPAGRAGDYKTHSVRVCVCVFVCY